MVIGLGGKVLHVKYEIPRSKGMASGQLCPNRAISHYLGPPAEIDSLQNLKILPFTKNLPIAGFNSTVWCNQIQYFLLY